MNYLLYLFANTGYKIKCFRLSLLYIISSIKCYVQICFCKCVILHFNSELTQEVASKGLGLVYELGGEERKEELVKLLVDTLMSGRR